MRRFDANQCLPKNIRIKSAEKHLYGIGLSFHSYIAKNIITNPKFIFIIGLFFNIKLIVASFLPENHEYLFIIFGDLFHFLNKANAFRISIAFYIILSLISQLIYYYNYKNDIKPTFLKVFEMMSGLVSPKSIGLTNKTEIYRLLKITRISFNICNKFFIPMILFIVIIVTTMPYINNCSLLMFIVIVIPNSLLITLTAYYVNSINLWQWIYFSIICYYLKIKLKESNQQISNIITNKRLFNSKSVLVSIRSINSIYSEINEYNNTFWSKYLLSIWFIFGFVLNLLLFSILFKGLNLFFNLLLIILFLIFITMFVFIVNMSSAVNYEANKSYKLLNSLLLSYNKSLPKTQLRYYISLKFKVNKRFKIILNNNLYINS